MYLFFSHIYYQRNSAIIYRKTANKIKIEMYLMKLVLTSIIYTCIYKIIDTS